MGATVIEKHFKLLNDKNCVDVPVSIDEITFKNMTKEIANAKKIKGIINFGIKKEEKKAKIFLRKKII